MKIKSLLLGSAAVMVAATGARAADAIIIEPEPVEYVRVCDAYGAGWWYIPGTETCIKFDGDVRVDYDVFNYHDFDSTERDHNVRYRARLNVRANNETEYGTLASRIRFRGGDESMPSSDPFSTGTTVNRAAVVVDWAVISLAGFRVGYSDTYWATAGGYGFYNARFDGPYGFQEGMYLDYTYASNGWTATVGIQSTGTAFLPQGASGTAGQPDMYGGITYTGSGWYLAGIVYYDSSQSEAAYKFRADYDMSSIAPGLSVGGWYMSDDGNTDYVKGHAWGVTARMNLTDNLVLFGGYGDYTDLDLVDANNRSGTQWVGGVRWNVVSGLYIQGEYQGVANDDESAATGNGANYGRFNLRIVRSF